MTIETNTRNPFGRHMTTLDTTSVSEAMTQSGLDFTIEKLPVTVDVITDEGVTRMPMPDNSGIIARWGNTIVPFRTVGKGYEVIQNAEAFEPLEYLIREGFVSRIEQAGFVKAGRRVFMLAALGEESFLADPHQRMIMFSTAHDGSGSLTVRGWQKRLACANQIPMVLRKGTAISTIRHSSNAKQYMAQTTDAVLAAIGQMEAYDLTMEKLLQSSVTDYDVELFLEKLFPLPENMKSLWTGTMQESRTLRTTREKRATTSRLINGKNNTNIVGTAASLFAGAVEWSDYHSQGDRGARILNGTDVKFKQRALQYALAN